MGCACSQKVYSWSHVTITEPGLLMLARFLLRSVDNLSSQLLSTCCGSEVKGRRASQKPYNLKGCRLSKGLG